MSTTLLAQTAPAVGGHVPTPHPTRLRLARLALATAAMLLAGAACSAQTETSLVAGQADESAANAQPAPTDEAQPQASNSRTSPGQILRSAEDAWRAQDWATLGQFATADVVAAAQAASAPGGAGPLGSVVEDLDQAWTCALGGEPCDVGLWSCDAGGIVCRGELLFDADVEPDEECCALIYRVSIDDLAEGFRLTSLEFGGDAG